jgi:hypothetical protein
VKKLKNKYLLNEMNEQRNNKNAQLKVPSDVNQGTLKMNKKKSLFPGI